MAHATVPSGVAAGARRGAEPVRVLLAADDPVVLHAAHAALAADPRLVVAGTSSELGEAGGLVRRLLPHVLVVATASREPTVVASIRAARGASPAPAVVVMAERRDEPYVRMMLESGARGYVSAAETDLVSAVRAVASGGAWFSPDVASVVRRGYLRRGGLSIRALLDRLTEPEREVLQALVYGQTPGEIGARLRLSAYAIAGCRRRIVESLA